MRPLLTLLSLALLAVALPTRAATITVDSASDDGVGCTLREAVEAANTDAPVGGCTAGDDADDTILFSISTVALAAGHLEVTEAVAIVGPVAVTAAPDARILLVSGSGTVELTDVTLKGGHAGEGGAVRIAGAATVVVSGGAATGNIAPFSGGAFWVSATGQLEVDGTAFTGNRARGDAPNQGGGAIYTDGGRVTVENATFTDNRALGDAGSGGAILSPNGATVRATASTFTANRSWRAGGAIEAVGGSVLALGTDFDGNNAGTTPGNGGAIHGAGGASVTVSGGTAQRNRAEAGGAFWVGAGSSLSLTSATVRGNFANGDAPDQGGGGVYVDGGSATLFQPTFVDNRATGAAGSGGALFLHGGTVSASSATFEQNRANRAGGAVEVVRPSGGPTTAVSFNGGAFRFNQAGGAPGNGGALHSSGGGVVLSASNVAFEDNIAEAEGGGVWIGAGTSLTLSFSTFDRNTARGDAADAGGGALFNDGGEASIFGATAFRDNRAFGAAGSGGALFAAGGTTTLSNAAITGNAASRAGGGLEAADGAVVTVTGGAISGNRARTAPGNGGGVHVTGAGTVTLDGVTVRGNAAGAEGGGLWNSASGSLTIVRSTVAENEAPDGGGIYQDGGGALSVSESLIHANRAVQSGGGLAARSGATVTVENTTVYGNEARFGGGIHSEEAGLEVGSATIAANAARTAGGGLYNTDADRTVALQNTIVAANEAPNGPDLAGRYASAGHNLIGTLPGAGAFPPGTDDQLEADPLLSPLDDFGGPTWTVALRTGSPAIDAGQTALATDQRGEARAAPHDVGAYDYGMGVLPIAQARALGAGASVAVEGTVSRALGSFVYLEDDTGGLTIRQTSGPFHIDIDEQEIVSGTVVRVRGTLSNPDHFLMIDGGGLESYELLGEEEPPSPTQISFAELAQNGESYESRLVQIGDAEFEASGTFAPNTSYAADDVTGSGTVRIIGPDDTWVDGLPIADTPTDVVGIVDQFSPSDPAGGYRVRPIKVDDTGPVPIVIAINEVFPDPTYDSSGISTDANGDGVSEPNDQFIEIVNTGNTPVDIGGLYIETGLSSQSPVEDSYFHRFAEDTVLDIGEAIVVFSGGNPVGGFGGAQVVVSSVGYYSLQFCDDVFVLQGQITGGIGSGGTQYASFPIFCDPTNQIPDQHQSGARSPDLTGDAVTHWSIRPVRYSPGLQNDTGAPFPVFGGGASAAPEASLEAPPTEPVRLEVAPNPFDTRAEASIVIREGQALTVSLYDVTGRRVARLFEGPVEAGAPVKVALDGSRLAAGVYVVVVEGETVRATRPVTVVR